MIARLVAGGIGFLVGALCAAWFVFVVTALWKGLGAAIEGYPAVVVTVGVIAGLYAALRT